MANKVPGLTHNRTAIPPRDLGGQGKYIYGILEENKGNQVVNLAQAIDDITTPGSGMFVNTTPSSSGQAPDNTYISIKELLGSNSKVIFSADYAKGLDTLFEWDGTGRDNGAYNFFPESRYFTFSDSAIPLNSISVIPNTNRLETTIDTTSPDGTIFTWQSKNRINLSESGDSLVLMPGVYEHLQPTPNTFTYSLNFKNPFLGNFSFQQQNWNIDNFDGSGSGSNPSGILLDSASMKKIQCPAFHFSINSRKDMLFGFVIDDVLYYAHRLRVNNGDNLFVIENQQIPFGNTYTNLKESFFIDGNFITKNIGLHEDSFGVWFSTTMNSTAQPLLFLTQYSYSPVIYSIGSDSKKHLKPFEASTAENLVSIIDTDIDKPILSVRPNNKAQWTFDKIKITASGQDSNYGCYIKVIHNATLANDNFNNSPDTAPDIKYDVSATSAATGFVLFSGYVYSNQTIDIEKSDLLTEFNSEFSKKVIDYRDGASTQTITKEDTITITASALSVNTPGSPVNVGVSVIGGEVG